MSRVIKFRAWDEARKKMQKSPKFVSFKINSKGEMSAENYTPSYKLQQMPVMQFTGLLDVNGVEIYEGDILRHESNYQPYSCVMEWSDELGSCGCCYPDCSSVGFVGVVIPGSDYSYSSLASGYESMKVIGNIHQNKELLPCVD